MSYEAGAPPLSPRADPWQTLTPGTVGSRLCGCRRAERECGFECQAARLPGQELCSNGLSPATPGVKYLEFHPYVTELSLSRFYQRNANVFTLPSLSETRVTVQPFKRPDPTLMPKRKK